MIIGNHDTATAPLLIAEIGNNHEGDRALAMDLVDAALEAGADAVKIQLIDPPRLVSVTQKERIAQLGRYRLPLDDYLEMGRRTRAKGRLFMASAFDVDSLAAILPELDAVKIASGDLNFPPLLEKAAASGVPVILSSGMATLDEIRASVALLVGALPAGRSAQDTLAVLHCVSLYPTPIEQANLAAITTLKAAFDLTIGYSDHTLGPEAAVVAVALGARIVEKHFTLDKGRTTFRDHALSADPADLRRLAEVLRQFDAMLGSGARSDAMADAETRLAVRRSLVAARDLPEGAIVGASDIDCVRPGTGMPPTAAASVVGRRLRRSLCMHDQFQEADLA